MGWGVSPTPRPPLPPGKTRYPFYRRLVGPQSRFGWAENLVPTRIRTRTVQPIVSRCTRRYVPLIIVKQDIPLRWRSTEVRTAAVNHNSSLYVVKFHCNMFRLMYKDPSPGWRVTREKLCTAPCGAREPHHCVKRVHRRIHLPGW